jgi:ferric-dicitrate binding protein FerR (iron transport regulator)
MVEQRMPISNGIENDPLHLAAADWLVRLQSTEISLEETLAWQAWIHENPANAEAFARIEEISHALRDLSAPAAVPAALLARDHYDASVPIVDWKPREAALRWPWPTEFNVERDSDRAVVSVTEGRVEVKPVTGLLPVSLLQGFKPKLRSVRVNAGQQTTAGSAGIEEPTKMEDPATGWQIGHLAFRLQPLRYVLEDVNRYAHKPIVLESESMGTLVITGTVERENIGGWVKSLERAFDLRATEEADQIVLRVR